mmetsp:Transcript_45134/g.73549  ORF Transcript_45134/g.73549 Transcript_45134/m.73549 type:complete len:81 (+) Transcript_45134:531-773(+)
MRSSRGSRRRTHLFCQLRMVINDEGKVLEAEEKSAKHVYESLHVNDARTQKIGGMRKIGYPERKQLVPRKKRSKTAEARM